MFFLYYFLTFTMKLERFRKFQLYFQLLFKMQSILSWNPINLDCFIELNQKIRLLFLQLPQYSNYLLDIQTFKIKVMSKVNQIILLMCLLSVAMLQDYTSQNKWDGECKTGKKQSPINIKTRRVQHCQPRFTFNLTSTNGNYTQIAYDRANENLKTPFNLSTITVTKNRAPKVFKSLQFHFHHKSQHHINRKEYDIELHIVHQAEDKSLAVFAILFEAHEGQFSDPFDNWHLNTATPVDQPFPIKLDTPKNVFHYQGSLTTPNCTEGVQWFVNENIVKIKQSNLEILAELINEGKRNDRDIQKLHRRKVAESGAICYIHNFPRPGLPNGFHFNSDDSIDSPEVPPFDGNLRPHSPHHMLRHE